MKQLIINSIFLLLAGTITFFINNAVLGTNQNSDFSLFSIYLFFLMAAITIVTGVYLTSVYLPDKAAYSFLIGMFLKLGLFMMIFLSSSEQVLSASDKVSILTPLVLFLVLEVFMIYNKLNHQKEEV